MHDKDPIRQIPDWALLLTVFVTGACVLLIEIIGTRILAPFFGSGIYTWSALIAITLAALALGYSVGGRLADRTPRTALLYALCLPAGLWTLLTPQLARWLLPELVQFADLRVAVLVSGSLLFFPNLFLLGAIGPFAIRLITHRQAVVGSTSGLVFAVSTLGSLLAALGTGFILIPNFGVQAIFTATGLVLLVLALAGNFRPRFVGVALASAALVLLVMVLTGRQQPAHAGIEVLDCTPSFYGNLHVIRKNHEMSLLADGIGQNYVEEKNRWVTPYLNFITGLTEMKGAGRGSAATGLVIGLGAGQLPMMLERAGIAVDAVEIDPKVGQLARRHFGYRLTDGATHYMDGRVFLARAGRQYDYIVMDAFRAEQVAWHLVSREALAAARARLAPGGLLAINYTSIEDGEDVAALQNTLQQVFPNTRTYALDYGHRLQSIVFVATNEPFDPAAHLQRTHFRQRHDVKRFLAGEVRDLGSDLVLSDDYNPVNEQRRHVQMLWRRAMQDYFGGATDWLLF